MSESSKPIVLLCDDDHDYLDQLSIQFTEFGYQVLEADSEDKAREILKTTKPNLCVLDLMIDQMDGGFTLAYQIKKQHPDVPVLIITGVTAETGLVFEKSGSGEQNWIKADAVLAKPVRFEQIRRELERLGVHHD